MIPVTLQPNRRHYTTPCFTCFHCHGEFRIRNRGRGGKKLFCVDCEDLKNYARIDAREKLYERIKAGLIEHPGELKCVDCGSDADRYDHRDYSKPYDVEPVCCSCNGKRGPAILGAK